MLLWLHTNWSISLQNAVCGSVQAHAEGGGGGGGGGAGGLGARVTALFQNYSEVPLWDK